MPHRLSRSASGFAPLFARLPESLSAPLFSSTLAAALCMMGLLGAGRAQAGYFDDKHYPIVTDAVFTADDFILDQARFWYAIYAEVGDDEGLLHDPFYPDLVFRKVSAPGQGRGSAKIVEGHVHQLQGEIRAMLAKDTASWTPQERKLRATFPDYWDSTGIILSCDRLRFQRGLKGKYRAGLERSYRYLPLIDSIMLAEGVPERLRFLPHVESSFYPFAYSKVGAAGMWQFMKSSAKRFKVKVTYQVDERRDPQVSTQAAARMLAYNFRLLKSWPLAIVAYNHGPGGLAVAARQTGTRDLGTIIKSYYSNSFGFASKNFYAEFLAASSIALKADSLFPDLRKMEPLQYQYLILSKPLATRYLCTVTGLTPDELEEYNLGLRPTTFRGTAQLPKGFALRLPASTDLASISAKLGGQVLASAAMPRAASAHPPAPVAVALAEPSAVPALAPAAPSAGVTDTLPQATLAMANPQDKVDNRAGNADPSVVVPDKAKAKLSAKSAAKAAKEAVKVAAAAKTSGQEPKPQAAISGVSDADVASWKTPREAAREKVRDRILENTRESAPGKTPAAKPANAKPPQPIGPVATATPSVPQSAALPKSGPGPSTSSAAATASSSSSASANAAANSAAQNPVSTSVAVAAPSSEAGNPDEHLVDPALALQASDLDKLAHPMDRFNPATYKLDYTYADGNLSFLAGPEETLSHYAEWAWVSEKTLRNLNKIRNPKDFRIGRRIRIPLTEEKAKEFQKRREEFYRANEEDFYGNYYVSITEPFVVEKGMNLWSWSQEREIPFWLLQKHNPGKALNELHPGDTLNLPVIETGIRKWGFTRYANSKEYLSGISRFLATGKPEAF